MNIAPLGPVAGAYYLDNSRVAVIEGPVGSGKSTASCLRLQRHAYEQVPGTDGVARTRWAIVRNTKKQLLDTTLKTWLMVFPENMYGRFEKSVMTHHWSFKPKGYSHAIDAEFIFRALDDSADVSDLLSLEVTGFWFNELREIVRDILSHAGRRCRFLNGDRPSTWSGWIGDTNPWDTQHYLQDDLVRKPRPGWKHFQQPGGMDPEAENLENLEQTEETLKLPIDDPRRREQGRTYYVKALADYSEEDARVYVHAQRGRTRAGKPIYTEYRDTVHCRTFELVQGIPLSIGIDFGRTPAAAIGQHLPTGQWRWRYELCAFDMGVKRFGEELKRFLGEKCPDFEIGNVTGDPAGNAEDGNDFTAFDLLAAAGITCRPATTNEISVRIEAVQSNFRKMVDGQPAMIVHPDCKLLREACIDGYRYRKLQVAGERYDDKPDKNQFSHIAEALQYGLLGGGEGRVVLARPKRGGGRPRFAKM
jgi:hypothetical protein